MKSKDWLDRQKKDQFVNKARLRGYPSRAAFKLLEIDKKFQFISKSKLILDLGSSPGGWSQVALEINPKVKIQAFDLLDMVYSHSNINFIKEDFLNYDYNMLLNKFDLIMSDIAPNTIGHKSTDHLRIASMIEDMLAIIEIIAKPSSSFFFKIWKGSEEKKIINILKKKYKEVSYFKPISSRAESSEIFIVAQNFME